MSLPLPLGLAVEQGIEALMKLDPESRDRLAALDGKLIRINVTAPALSVTLSVVEGRVYVVGGVEEDSPADTTITGSLAALCSLTSGNDAVYRGEVSIEGDIGVGQQLKAVLAGLDPDWEEFISPLVGDSPAHWLGTNGRQLRAWLSRTRSAMQQNTSEYLQEEAEVLAPNSEVHAFCAEVDELRAAADRLDARVQRLERERGEPR
jgi:ubiquinone biosynthesis protein UbiJ